MTTYETLLINKADGVGVITLNRPTKRNAMNPALHRDMTAPLEDLRNDVEAKSLSLPARVTCFGRGMDLKEFFVALKDKPAEYEAVWKMAVEWRGPYVRYLPKARSCCDG